MRRKVQPRIFRSTHGPASHQPSLPIVDTLLNHFIPSPTQTTLIRIMSPSPISPSTVHVLLNYILPPSQIDQPLPPYLLSKDLLQRHHFLSILPDAPDEYLCWPTSSPDAASKAIQLLESLPTPLDDEPPSSYPTQYQADGEHTYAHVNLTSTGDDGVRLVFQWDYLHGWKYHNLGLMPFPAGTQSSLLETLAKAPVVEEIHVSTDHNHYGFDSHSDGSDDDDYWNAYGSHDDHADSPAGYDFLQSKDAAANTEDAYWAQYSSVHGTADSTRPSPLPLHRRKPHALEQMPSDPDSPHPLPVPVRGFSENASEDALPIAPSIYSSRSLHIARSPWDPASPETLARLLSTISPRLSPRLESAELLEDSDPDADSISPPTDSSTETQTEMTVHPRRISESQAHDADEGLMVSIRGLYSLWKASRGNDDDKVDKAAFMRIVAEVIE
ncbi:hypothetical protein ABKN59_001202 [Abortiporus biennis]